MFNIHKNRQIITIKLEVLFNLKNAAFVDIYLGI